MVKDLPTNAGDLGSIPETGRSSEVGNSNRLQYSCLGNPRVRGAWRATVHGITKPGHDSVYTHTHTFYYTPFYSNLWCFTQDLKQRKF